MLKKTTRAVLKLYQLGNLRLKSSMKYLGTTFHTFKNKPISSKEKCVCKLVCCHHYTFNNVLNSYINQVFNEK